MPGPGVGQQGRAGRGAEPAGPAAVPDSLTEAVEARARTSPAKSETYSEYRTGMVLDRSGSLVKIRSWQRKPVGEAPGAERMTRPPPSESSQATAPPMAATPHDGRPAPQHQYEATTVTHRVMPR